MEYKKEEIKQYAMDTIKENLNHDNDYLNKDVFDVHHDLFNSDYYIIGYYEATQWLENQVFNVIQYIKEYEIDNYGEVTSDFSSSESVVNMYVFIIGEEIIEDVIKEVKKSMLIK
tara:strand:+ start:212 stop:556 length:345 start_codon:yes stop_codon:yes gene_type:complete